MDFIAPLCTWTQEDQTLVGKMESIALRLLESSPALAAFVVIVYFLFKRFSDAQEARIKALEDHARQCNEDRAQLHEAHTHLHDSHSKLQQEVIEKLSDIIAKHSEESFKLGKSFDGSK